MMKNEEVRCTGWAPPIPNPNPNPNLKPYRNISHLMNVTAADLVKTLQHHWWRSVRGAYLLSDVCRHGEALDFNHAWFHLMCDWFATM